MIMNEPEDHKQSKPNARICFICKFFIPDGNNDEFKTERNHLSNKVYGCDHKRPLTINERILLTSPNSTILPAKGDIKLFNYPIGTHDENFNENNETNKFKEMLKTHEPGTTNYEYISRKLAMDQEGSKHLQTYLENLTTNCRNESERINLQGFKKNLRHGFQLSAYQKEIFWFAKVLQRNLFELSNDPFANYVIQKLLEEKYLHRFFEENLLKHNVCQLSKEVYSCRVVQKAVYEIDKPQFIFVELLKEFDDLFSIQSSNHVIQKVIEKCIETSDLENLSKIINYSIKNLIKLSNDKYGCRILQKILEIKTIENKECIQFNRKVSKLLNLFHNLIIKNLDILSTDQYGNYVVQYILTLNLKIKDVVIKTMLENIRKYSQQKFASNIIEKVILAKEECYTSLIFKKLLENVDGKPCLYFLAKDKYGNYVVQQFYKTLGVNERLKINTVLKKYLFELKGNVYSKHLAHKMSSDK